MFGNNEVGKKYPAEIALLQSLRQLMAGSRGSLEVSTYTKKPGEDKLVPDQTLIFSNVEYKAPVQYSFGGTMVAAHMLDQLDEHGEVAGKLYCFESVQDYDRFLDMYPTFKGRMCVLHNFQLQTGAKKKK